MKVLLLLLAFTILTHSSWSQEVAINEVMSSNGATTADEDGDYGDWIELHNYGNSQTSLSGFHLSDDPDNPQRWTFPDVSIAPGGYLLVWASGKDRSEGDHLHTNFSISQAGEPLLLSAPDGTLLDQVEPVFIPRDRSYGRSPDGTGNWTFFLEPTPGRANTATGYSSFLEPPVPSASPGFHSSTFHLELISSEPGAAIRYTLDGSVPDETSALYTAPIQIRDRSSDPNVFSSIRTSFDWSAPPPGIFKGTVVRAIALADGHVRSEPATFTYFVHPNIQSRYQLPIVSISVERDSLFGDARGIYVPGDRGNQWTSPPRGNFTERGPEWERPAHMEFFSTDGHRVASLGSGLRIHGGWSRSFRMKSLRVYFRSEYDEQNALEYPVFPSQDRANYKRLILRNSGNDFGYTMFRDGLMQRLVSHLQFDTQDFQPMAVFINGEFWGLHNLRERVDDRYVENVYGVDVDDVDMLEINGNVVYGEDEHYFAMLEAIDAGVELDEIETRMDIGNFINYHLSQVYFDNGDWPNNNIRFWRKRTVNYDPAAAHGHDGRWRWMMYDTDFGFGLYDPGWVHNNTLRHALNLQPLNDHGASDEAARLFRGLLRYPDFRTRYLNAFADQLNTTFRPERVVSLIDEMQDAIRPIYDEHRRRWGLRDMGSWEGEVSALRAFAEQRPGVQRNHLTAYFSETPGTSRLTVNVSDPAHGIVRVNSIDIEASTPGIGSDPYPWSGDYFRSVPVMVIAKPQPGYRLVRWEGVIAPASDTISVTLGIQNVSILATFERYIDPQPAAHVVVEAPYEFSSWSSTSPAGTYPANMEFRQSRVVDPDLSADFPDLYVLPYDMTSTTRIEGHDDGGIAFINTGNTGNLVDGAVGRDLGAAVLGLDTQNCTDVFTSWVGTTVHPNSREYAIRLQYRIGDDGPFQDVMDIGDNVIEYRRAPVEGHAQAFTDIPLPASVSGQPYVQLRWVYHHLEGTSGPRAMLGLNDIRVTCERSPVDVEGPIGATSSFALEAPYPNPFDRVSSISFALPVRSNVRLVMTNVLGQDVRTLVNEETAAGEHTVTVDASDLPSGLYFLRLEAGSSTATRTLVVVK